VVSKIVSVKMVGPGSQDFLMFHQPNSFLWDNLGFLSHVFAQSTSRMWAFQTQTFFAGPPDTNFFCGSSKKDCLVFNPPSALGLGEAARAPTGHLAI